MSDKITNKHLVAVGYDFYIKEKTYRVITFGHNKDGYFWEISSLFDNNKRYIINKDLLDEKIRLHKKENPHLL